MCYTSNTFVLRARHTNCSHLMKDCVNLERMKNIQVIYSLPPPPRKQKKNKKKLPVKCKLTNICMISITLPLFTQ